VCAGNGISGIPSQVQEVAKWAQANSGGVAHTDEAMSGECACIFSCMFVYVFVQLGDLFLHLLACVCAQATVPSPSSARQWWTAT
jgi:hypothetical protein